MQLAGVEYRYQFTKNFTADGKAWLLTSKNDDKKYQLEILLGSPTFLSLVKA
jgi:hypothetical protein